MLLREPLSVRRGSFLKYPESLFGTFHYDVVEFS